MIHWEKTQKCTEMNGGFYPEMHYESLDGININIFLHRKFKTKKMAKAVLTEIIKRIFPKGVGVIAK